VGTIKKVVDKKQSLGEKMREQENLSIVIGQYIIFYTTAQELPHSKRFWTQQT